MATSRMMCVGTTSSVLLPVFVHRSDPCTIQRQGGHASLCNHDGLQADPLALAISDGEVVSNPASAGAVDPDRLAARFSRQDILSRAEVGQLLRQVCMRDTPSFFTGCLFCTRVVLKSSQHSICTSIRCVTHGHTLAKRRLGKCIMIYVECIMIYVTAP